MTPVVNGDSSPFTAEIEASSIIAMPSVVSPAAILRLPMLISPNALRSASRAPSPISMARSASVVAVSMSPLEPAPMLWMSAR